MQEANRIKRLPLYLFTIMDDFKAKAKARGMDVIDLGMGNPDLPSPPHVVEALCQAVRNPVNHRYSSPIGDVEARLKQAIAQWYQQRFNISLDPNTEVLPLIGSKEGIAHLVLTFLNTDDIGLVPNPTYPPHANSVTIAGGVLHDMPIGPENNFAPNFRALPRDIVEKSKIMFVSYPNNPTAACVDLSFYQDLVDWAKGKELIVCSDLAYSDFVYDGYKAPSLFHAKGAKEIYGIEFHTLSKSYNMAGWRIGWAVGNPQILRSLAKTKSYIDFGIFRAVQEAAIAALTGPQDCVKETIETYRQRRDFFVKAMSGIGWNVPSPKATFYIWTKIPSKFGQMTSLEFAQLLVDKAGVVVAPGSGFGERGEGFVRFALVEPEPRLKLAAERIQKILG